MDRWYKTIDCIWWFCNLDDWSRFAQRQRRRWLVRIQLIFLWIKSWTSAKIMKWIYGGKNCELVSTEIEDEGKLLSIFFINGPYTTQEYWVPYEYESGMENSIFLLLQCIVDEHVVERTHLPWWYYTCTLMWCKNINICLSNSHQKSWEIHGDSK